MIKDSSTIIDKLGGSACVARLCQVSPQAVSKWKRQGIPPARLMYLQLAAPQAFTDSSSAAFPNSAP